MGTCQYYLKASWAAPLTKAQADAVYEFFRQAGAYENASYRGKVTPAELRRDFPLVARLSKAERVDLRVQDAMDQDVCSLLDINGIDVRYGAEVSHMATWGPLCTILKRDFGAARADWVSEESDGVGPGAVLEMQDDTTIVDALLAKPTKELPAYLGIHPLLDARIAERLAKEKK